MNLKPISAGRTPGQSEYRYARDWWENEGFEVGSIGARDLENDDVAIFIKTIDEDELTLVLHYDNSITAYRGSGTENLVEL